MKKLLSQVGKKTREAALAAVMLTIDRGGLGNRKQIGRAEGEGEMNSADDPYRNRPKATAYRYRSR